MDTTESKPVSLRNSFLLATPAMRDSRFRFAVVFVVSHDRSGAMGIIVNKSKPGLYISDLLEQVGISGEVQVADAPVLNGGPVDIDRGFVLHSSTKDVLESLVSDNHPKSAMLAVGYAGWGPGQLEKEIAENSWLVTDADESLLFSEDLGSKWGLALEEVGIDPSCLSQAGGKA